MKKNFLLLISLVLTSKLISQQDIQLSNFDYLSSYYNPATITNTPNICGNVIGRNQWAGLSGRPNTGLINTTYNFSNRFWGNVLFTRDEIGLQKQNLIKLGLAKSFTITSDTKISFGLNLNYSNTHWTSNFITPDTPVQDDFSIPNNNLTTNNLDMDAGLFIQSKNLLIGLSSTHLTQPILQQPSFSFQHKRHYYLLCGYTLNKKLGDFENFLLAKSDVASTQIDVKTNFWSNNGWMIGLAYRISDAIIPMIGYQKTIKRLTVRGIYSYDLTTSKLNNYSSGTHEICVKFCIAPLMYTERYTHPRHLGTWK